METKTMLDVDTLFISIYIYIYNVFMPLYNVLCKELTSYKYFAYRIPACNIFTETETSLYATTVP